MVNLPAKDGVSAAFANHGEWRAWCGHPYACDGAATLAHFQAGFQCQSCGRSTDVVWPSVDMVAGVERLLLMRPNPKNRNWFPHEDLHDLLEENVQHGVISRHAAAIEAGGILAVVGDRITVDALPYLNPIREMVH